MTKEQYIAAINEQDQAISNINEYKRLLTSDYIQANRIYNDGDRVRISGKGGYRYAIIQGAKVNWNGKIEYILYKEKKDGAPSLVKDYVWFYETMEPAPKA